MTKKKSPGQEKELPQSSYFDRDLSWLKFNERVLDEALDIRNPLLERLRFSEIFITNLEEFVMKRIGRLKTQIKSGKGKLTNEGKTATQLLFQLRKIVKRQSKKLSHNFNENLLPQLKEQGINFLNWKDLSEKEVRELNRFYKKDIFPILTPLAVDSAHPFPFISNQSKSLGISLTRPGDETLLFSRVKISKDIPSWVSIGRKEKAKYTFISIEELVINNLNALFPGMEVKDYVVFKVIRSAVWREDGEAEDVLEMVEDGIRERKFNPVVLLEHTERPDKWILDFVLDELNIDLNDAREMNCFLHYKTFGEIYKIDRPDLKFRPYIGKTPKLLEEASSIFPVLKNTDLLIHSPFESFSSSVERFIKDASNDKDVLAIKMTLYRTEANSKIITSLINAADNGKQVVCIIELKARFDEENNIRWAEKLEQAGVHVVYGLVGLKTHSKIALVVRKESDGVKTYCHIGTGNYNAQTSKFYTDFNLLTANQALTNEIIEVFNFLTGRSLKDNYEHLLVAPINMKKKFIELIANEGTYGNKGKIIAKMNQLEDDEIIAALYSASNAGVKIELLVRGFCCLRPGMQGLSENINVYSTLGRFLEHSRVFFFKNGSESLSDQLFYLGSADWMHRNLNNRVEVIVPVLGEEQKQKIYNILNHYLLDLRQTWILKPDGNYVRRKRESSEGGVHKLLMRGMRKKV